MPATEWTILLYALVLLPVVTWTGRVLGYRAAKRLLACLTPLHFSRLDRTKRAQMVQASMMTDLVAVAAERSFSIVPCWLRALVLYRLLQRQRIRSEIRFGVVRKGKGIQAHAWVELDGRVFDPSGNCAEFYVAALTSAIALRSKSCQP